MTKPTKAQLNVLREVSEGRDPFGRSTAVNRMMDRMCAAGLLETYPLLVLTDEGKAVLAATLARSEAAAVGGR